MHPYLFDTSKIPSNTQDSINFQLVFAMKFPAERLPAEINKQYVSFATLLGQSALLLPLLKPTTNQP
jgi:hypothetical protein